MRLAAISALIGLVLATAPAAAAPAHGAQFGAIAYDKATGRAGLSARHHSLYGAERQALHECRARGCRVVVRIAPKQCGAFATTMNKKHAGAAARRSLDETKLAAIKACERAKAGKCVVRLSACNK